MMFHEIYDPESYENALRCFTTAIDFFAANGECQYLRHDTLLWKIEKSNSFAFRDFYYVNRHVPVFSQLVWDTALSIVDSDGLFQIPLTIELFGERHHYTIVIPSRIRCLDCRGNIMPNHVGRYHLFRSDRPDDNKLYVSEELWKVWKDFPTLNFRRS